MKIQEKIPANSTFFALEINNIFVNATRETCPGINVYNDCATNTRKYLEKHGHKECSCIISGLPWSVFSETLQNDLLDTVVDVLESGGRFLTFAYLQGMILPKGLAFRKKLQSRFRTVKKTGPVWVNFPPAIIYYAEK